MVEQEPITAVVARMKKGIERDSFDWNHTFIKDALDLSRRPKLLQHPDNLVFKHLIPAGGRLFSIQFMLSLMMGQLLKAENPNKEGLAEILGLYELMGFPTADQERIRPSLVEQARLLRERYSQTGEPQATPDQYLLGPAGAESLQAAGSQPSPADAETPSSIPQEIAGLTPAERAAWYTDHVLTPKEQGEKAAERIFREFWQKWPDPQNPPSEDEVWSMEEKLESALQSAFALAPSVSRIYVDQYLDLVWQAASSCLAFENPDYFDPEKIFDQLKNPQQVKLFERLFAAGSPEINKAFIVFEYNYNVLRIGYYEAAANLTRLINKAVGTNQEQLDETFARTEATNSDLNRTLTNPSASIGLLVESIRNRNLAYIDFYRLEIEDLHKKRNYFQELTKTAGLKILPGDNDFGSLAELTPEELAATAQPSSQSGAKPRLEFRPEDPE